MTHFFNQRLRTLCATVALATGLQAAAPSSDLDLTGVKILLGENASRASTKPTTQVDVQIHVNENAVAPFPATSQLFPVHAERQGNTVERLLLLNFILHPQINAILIPAPLMTFCGGGIHPRFEIFISEQGSMFPSSMNATNIVQGSLSQGVLFDFLAPTGDMVYYQRSSAPMTYQQIERLPRVQAFWQDGSAVDFLLNFQADFVAQTFDPTALLPIPQKPPFEFVRMPNSNGGPQPALLTTVEGFFRSFDGKLRARVNQGGETSNRIVELI